MHPTIEREIQNDPIALAIVLVIIAIFAIVTIRKSLLAKKQVAAVAEEIPTPVQKPVAPGSAGKLKLYNVEPRTAAMLMAIVADKLGKPLNELRFLSVKEVEKDEV